MSRGLEDFAGSFQITMPRTCFVLVQFGFGQNFSQIAADTNFLIVRHKARERFTVLQKHKRNVLVVRPVNAVGKVARSLGDGYVRFLHKTSLSDYLILRTLSKVSRSERLLVTAKHPSTSKNRAYSQNTLESKMEEWVSG
jgi:hypothetical protein